MEKNMETPREKENFEGDSAPASPVQEEEKSAPFSADVISDQAAEDLCAMFGCSRESLGVLLKSVGPDPSGILTLARSLSPSYLAIKILFEPRRREGPGGAACLIARGSSGEIIDETSVAGSRSLLEGIGISADWEAFRATLRSFEGTGERDLYLAMTKIMKAVFLPTSVNRLFHEEEEKESIIGHLEKGFRDALHRDFIFSLSTETFNQARLESGGVARENAPVAPAQPGEPSPVPGKQGTLHIPCKPVLDPVRGKAVSDLKAGDRIYVQLDSTGGLSALVAKIFQRSGQETVFPLISLERLPSGQSLLRVAISPGVVGTVTGGTDVRLKVASPVKKEKKTLSPRGRQYIAAAVILGILAFLILTLLGKGGF